ncbi:hypothetical protein D9M73_36750 [compost metagenome]
MSADRIPVERPDPGALLRQKRPFSLGQVVATPAALELLAKNNMHPAALIQLHQGCEWGSVDREDAALNDRAVLHGGRIVGCHKVDGIDVWLITEPIGGERGNPIIGTTMLLASEY